MYTTLIQSITVDTEIFFKYKKFPIFQFIDKTTIKNVEAELRKIPGNKIAIQLKAILVCAHYPAKQVAEIFGVSTRTVSRWIDKFKSQGIEGLKDKPKGHLKAKLTDNHKEIIKDWIESGNLWTLRQLKIKIENDFKINISTTALWNHLKKMNLSIKK
ncbi:MAG: helix-turn-helix domain containing protein [Candidatus Aminicenantes bacterium]|nr:helix-turn-helix domain containing protein [Candidatus Aminicenantes bacterium]